jgi:lysophospholipase L1-like esterase
MKSTQRTNGNWTRKIFLFLLVLIAMVLVSQGVSAASCSEVKIALLGDSITNSYGTQAWGNELRKLCENNPVNYAHGGKLTKWMLQRLNGEKDDVSPYTSGKMLGQGYQYLVIMGGTNDINSDLSVDHITNNLAQIYSIARQDGMKVIASTISPFNKKSSVDKNEKVKQVNDWIRQQQATGTVDGIIDFYNFLVGEEPCMKSSYVSSCNNVHPSTAGYKAMAQHFVQQYFPDTSATSGAGGTSPVSNFNTMIVLGRHIKSEQVNRIKGAYELIQQGNFQKIILSGRCAKPGPNDNLNDLTCPADCKGCTEAEEMKKMLLQLNPSLESKIVLEDKSGSTASNYANSVKFLSAGDKVLVVSDHPHAKAVSYCINYKNKYPSSYYIVGKSSLPTTLPYDASSSDDYGGIIKNCKPSSSPNVDLPTAPITSSSGTSTPSSPSSAQPIPIALPQKEKDLDQSWSSKVGMPVRQSALIWDYSLDAQHSWRWQPFEKVYFSSVSTPGTSSGVVPGSSYSSAKKVAYVSPDRGACFKYILAENPSEAQSKLVSVPFLGKSISVNKIVAPLFKKINEEVTSLNLGYNFYSTGTYSWRCVKPNDGWNNDECLDNKGAPHRSRHSYGIAIDINPKENPYCYVNEVTKELCDDSARTKCGNNAVKCKGRGYDLPDQVAQIFRKYDFQWGGDWTTIKDYMHFEWLGHYGDFNGDGVLEQCSLTETKVNPNAQCQEAKPGWKCQCKSAFTYGPWTQQKCENSQDCIREMCFGSVNDYYCCSDDVAGETTSLLSSDLKQALSQSGAKLHVYDTACKSKVPTILGRREGLVVPDGVSSNPELIVYFHGHQKSPVEQYIKQKQLLEKVSELKQKGKEVVLVWFKGGDNHVALSYGGDGGTNWMKGIREGTTNSQFKCFYDETIFKLQSLGINPSKMSFMVHSNGGRTVTDVLTSKFIDEFHLPISSVIFLDACYGTQCQEVSQLPPAKRGTVYSYYTTSQEAGNTKDPSMLIQGMSQTVVKETTSGHGNIISQCFVDHYVDASGIQGGCQS